MKYPVPSSVAGRAVPYRKVRKWHLFINRMLARELSAFTRYYDRVVQWLPRPEDFGVLIDEIQTKAKDVIRADEPFPLLANEETRRTAVLLNGTLNHHYDVQGLLTELKEKLSRTSRLLLVLYNPYFRWAYGLANRLHLREGEVPTTFLRRIDLENLAKLSGFEIVQAA